jgi:hypothetical protein
MSIEEVLTAPRSPWQNPFVERLTLEPIPDDHRRPEADLWAEFNVERPQILGVLLDAIVEGLKRLPETHLPRLLRMADFARWATACETALWPTGAFWSAYSGNRDDAVDSVIDTDPVAAALRDTMSERTVWTGTAAKLLETLTEQVGERVAKANTWPASPRALSGRLRRSASFLRKIGIEIGFDHRSADLKRSRTIRITRATNETPAENARAEPSIPSASSVQSDIVNAANGFAAPHPRTDADDRREGAAQTVRANLLKSNAQTIADGADANHPSQSASENIGWRARL